MDVLWSEEMRLLYALLLLAAVVAGAWRFVARRLDTNWADRATDAALLVFVVQYVAVALPGVVGVLSPVTIALATIVLSAALYFVPSRGGRSDDKSRAALRTETAHSAAVQSDKERTRTPDTQDSRLRPRSDSTGVGVGGSANRSKPLSPRAAASRAASAPKPASDFDATLVLAATLFVAAYLLGLAAHQMPVPVLSNDALIYHFPAAVTWLQAGRITVFEPWFFNPPNAYSPLAGSAVIAWYMGPAGGDVLAKAAQFPPLALIFFATIRLARGLGVRPGAAAVLALGLVLSRPFVWQARIEKDDLYLAAFFAAVFAGLTPDRMRDRIAPLRLGVALGMALATKYTALMLCPILLLAIDAPFRAGWRLRHYALALVPIGVVAGPWYLRNALLTGNPLFPLDVRVFGHTLFTGLLTSAPSEQVRTPALAWHLITTRDQGMPIVALAILLLGLLASYVAAAAWRAAVFRAPHIRLCMVGPVVAFALFVLTCPYPEPRYLQPAYVLLAGALAIALNAWIRPARVPEDVPTPDHSARASPQAPSRIRSTPINSAHVQAIAAGFFALACVVQGLGNTEGKVILFAALGVAVAAVGLGARHLHARHPLWGRRVIGAGIGAIAISAWAYAAVAAGTSGAPGVTADVWRMIYGESAGIWAFVRDHLPPDERLAYTNSAFVYPLYGRDLRRPIVYVPTRRGVRRMQDLPHLPGPLPGERHVAEATAATVGDPDPATWLTRLRESGATHLAVFTQAVTEPPEVAIIRANARHFTPVFAGPGGVVYKLNW